MGAAEAVGDAATGNELLDAADVGDADNVADLDVDGLDLSGDVTDLEAAGALRVGGELCALANVTEPSANIAMATNETVDFMTALSLVWVE